MLPADDTRAEEALDEEEADTGEIAYAMALYYTRSVDEVPVSYARQQDSWADIAYGFEEQGETAVEMAEEMWELEVTYMDEEGEENREVIGDHKGYRFFMTINAMDGMVIDRTLGY